jgi:serine/threonine protein kinase
LSNEYLKEIETYNNKETIIVSSPFTPTDFFLSPELMTIKEIPSYIHYKTSYYSLGNLILYLFTEDEKTDEKEILANIHIRGTKLYWLLERMLEKNPKSRSILLL